MRRRTLEHRLDMGVAGVARHRWRMAGRVARRGAAPARGQRMTHQRHEHETGDAGNSGDVVACFVVGMWRLRQWWHRDVARIAPSRACCVMNVVEEEGRCRKKYLVSSVMAKGV